MGIRIRLPGQKPREAVLHARSPGKRSRRGWHADHRSAERRVLKPRPKSNGNGRAKSSSEHADYTSASLTTRGKGEWTYGRIEVRAKLPSGRGTWPAIWTLGTNIDQRRLANLRRDRHHGVCRVRARGCPREVHTKKYNHAIHTGKGDKTIRRRCLGGVPRLLRRVGRPKIDFFVDDHKYFTFRNEGTGTDAWPYDKDQYLILNLAIGGDWGGQKGVDDRIFPQRYYIDYVRVYQKPERNNGDESR